MKLLIFFFALCVQTHRAINQSDDTHNRFYDVTSNFLQQSIGFINYHLRTILKIAHNRSIHSSSFIYSFFFETLFIFLFFFFFIFFIILKPLEIIQKAQNKATNLYGGNDLLYFDVERVTIPLYFIFKLNIDTCGTGKTCENFRYVMNTNT